MHSKSSPPTSSMSSESESDNSFQGRPPNTVDDGKCQNCNSQESEEFVSCLFCKVKFHLNGCFENSDDDILNNSDAKSFYKAIHKIRNLFIDLETFDLFVTLI